MGRKGGQASGVLPLLVRCADGNASRHGRAREGGDVAADGEACGVQAPAKTVGFFAREEGKPGNCDGMGFRGRGMTVFRFFVRLLLAFAVFRGEVGMPEVESRAGIGLDEGVEGEVKERVFTLLCVVELLRVGKRHGSRDQEALVALHLDCSRLIGSFSLD